MTNSRKKIQTLIEYAETLQGTIYKWGGNNPLEGFDCSGYVCWLLKCVNLLKGDHSAQMLFDKLKESSVSNSPIHGSIVFYGSTLKSITHCAFALDTRLCMEAGGGGRKTTRKIAIIDGACVRLALIERRRDYLLACRPVYQTLGETKEYLSAYMKLESLSSK